MAHSYTTQKGFKQTPSIIMLLAHHHLYYGYEWCIKFEDRCAITFITYKLVISWQYAVKQERLRLYLETRISQRYGVGSCTNSGMTSLNFIPHYESVESLCHGQPELSWTLSSLEQSTGLTLPIKMSDIKFMKDLWVLCISWESSSAPENHYPTVFNYNTSAWKFLASLMTLISCFRCV